MFNKQNVVFIDKIGSEHFQGIVLNHFERNYTSGFSAIESEVGIFRACPEYFRPKLDQCNCTSYKEYIGFFG